MIGFLINLEWSEDIEKNGKNHLKKMFGKETRFRDGQLLVLSANNPNMTFKSWIASEESFQRLIDLFLRSNIIDLWKTADV